MNTHEVLKLALEALEHINDRFDLESVAQDATKAITAIKEALAQPEKGLFIDLIAQHDGLAEELAQPEQEPLEELRQMMQIEVDRLIAAKAPKRQPLTLNEISAMEEKVYMRTTHKGKPLFEYAQAFIRATEATHNIGVNT